ncbi:MAG TPA: nitronate monooxygenase [Bacillota bacterium]
MKTNSLMKELNIKYPIFQAPMAGVTTPTLVSSVSNCGALGNIGAGYLSAEETKDFILEVKGLTKQPFGVNLFVPENNKVTESEMEKLYQLLQFCKNDLQLNLEEIPSYKPNNDFDKQVEIVIEENIPVCSFTFGIPSEEIINKLKNNGTFVIGTATNVKEAQMVEKVGMNAVVVQGSEAGGHRGTFLEKESYIGTMSLIPQVVDHVSIPVIGAGGIMDGRGLMAALCLGANCVQLGTAFLTTKESGAHPLHKKAILQATEEDLQLTRAFSGKTARGIKNKFMSTMEKYESKLPPYPYQNSLTKKIRSAAAEQNNKDFMSLWSGQSPRLSKNITVNELINHIVKESEKISNHLNK